MSKRARRQKRAETSAQRKRDRRVLRRVRIDGEFASRHAADWRILRRLAGSGQVVVAKSKAGWFAPPELTAFATMADALARYPRSAIMRTTH